MSNYDDLFVEVAGRRFMRSFARARMISVPESKVPKRAVARHRALAAHALQESTNPDLAWTQFVLDTEGQNDNWDYMPRPALMRSFATATYKPFNMDHVMEEGKSMVGMNRYNPPVKNTIYGVMTQADLCDAKGNLLSSEDIDKLSVDDVLDRPESDKIGVCAWGAMYAFIFPKTVADVASKIERGEMYVSMERWIAAWDFLVYDGNSYKAVASDIAEMDGTFDRWAKHNTINSKPVLRRSLAFIYGAGASTENPANKASKFVTPTTVPNVARAVAEVFEDQGGKIFTTTDPELLSLVAVSFIQGIEATHAAMRAIASHNVEIDPMSQAQTPTNTVTPQAPIHIDQTVITQAVASAMNQINAQKDRDTAIAGTITALATDKATAVAKFERSEAALTEANRISAELRTQLADAQASITDLTTKHTTEAGKVVALTTELTTAKAAIAKADTEKAIASRTALVDKSTLPDDTKAHLKAQASKIGPDNKFEISDEALAANIKGFSDAFAAGKASVTNPAGAPPAAGTATGTPAPAPAAPGATAPAPVPAAANTTNPPAPVVAPAAAGAPPAPELGGIQLAKAMAGALGANQQSTADQRSKYATMFPATSPTN